MRAPIEVLSGGVIAASLLFGGTSAPERALIAIPELAGVILLAVVAVWGRPNLRANGAAVGLAVGLVAVRLLQLIPLPPELWTNLPGRSTLISAYGAAGAPLPWLPISLTPGATERATLALLPGMAVFFGMLCLGEDGRRRLTLLILGFGLASVLLGFAQLLGGPESPLRFYEYANRAQAVGFFANRNHNAAFLFSLLPFAATLVGSRGRKTAVTPIFLFGAALVVLLMGLAMAGSRSGLAFGLIAALAAVWGAVRLGFGGSLGRSRVLLWAGSLLLLLLPLLIALGVVDILGRFQSQDLSSDLRWQIARTAWTAALAFFPVGSGYGSFARAYQLFETPAEIMPVFINKAHNDWLEAIVEGGLPAILLMAAGLTWLVRRTVDIIRPAAPRPRALVLESAALAALWLLAAHSALDYPLSTPALQTLAAFSCGLLCRPAREAKPQPAAAEPSAWWASLVRGTRMRPQSAQRPWARPSRFVT